MEVGGSAALSSHAQTSAVPLRIVASLQEVVPVPQALTQAAALLGDAGTPVDVDAFLPPANRRVHAPRPAPSEP